MDDNELIERYLRGELSKEEIDAFKEKLSTDHAFKELFEIESVILKSVQYSIEKEKIKKLATAYIAEPKVNHAPQKSFALWHAGVAALAVWVVSNLASTILHVDAAFLKWFGVILAFAFSCATLVFVDKKFGYQLVRASVLNGLIIFVISSGIDAINQGIEIRSSASKGVLIPFTEQTAWWPTRSLVDSVDEQKRINQELTAEKIELRTIIASYQDSLRSSYNKNAPAGAPKSLAATQGSNDDVGAPTIRASTKTLYMNCGNKVLIEVPSLGANYDPEFSTGGSAEIIKGDHPGSITIIPKQRKVTVTVSNAGTAIGSCGFDVKDIPDPHYEVYVGNNPVDLSRGISTNQLGALRIVAEPETNFQVAVPKDARYRIRRAEVILNRETTNIQRINATNGYLDLVEWASQARPGDKIIIDIRNVVRLNYRDKEEDVEVVGSTGIIQIPINDR